MEKTPIVTVGCLAALAVVVAVGLAAFAAPAAVLLAGRNTSGLTRVEVERMFGEPGLRVRTTDATVRNDLLRTSALRTSEELLLYDVWGYTLVIGTKSAGRSYGSYVIPAFPHGIPVAQLAIAVVSVVLAWLLIAAACTVSLKQRRRNEGGGCPP